VLAGLVVLAMLLDGAIALFQPALEPGDAEAVLHTFDEQGQRYETRMIVIEDGGTLWVQSGHHFRGWYNRLRRHPEVELLRGGERRDYRAVALETPEAKMRMREMLIERTGLVRFYLIRTFLLFADVKPVRLDPVEADLTSLPSEDLLRPAAIGVSRRQGVRASFDQSDGSAGESTLPQELLHGFKPSPPRDPDSSFPPPKGLRVNAQPPRKLTD